MLRRWHCLTPSASQELSPPARPVAELMFNIILRWNAIACFSASLRLQTITMQVMTMLTLQELLLIGLQMGG